MLFYKNKSIHKDGSTDKAHESFVFVREDVEENGVRISRMVKKTPPDNFSGMSVRDFQLRELIESNAVDYLTPTAPISGDKFDAYQSASVSASNLEASLQVDESQVSESQVSEPATSE